MNIVSFNEISNINFAALSETELMSLNKIVIENINAKRKLAGLIRKGNFKVGDKVEWDDSKRGRICTGKVTKINRINMEVTELDNPMMRWRINPSYLRKMNEGN